MIPGAGAPGAPGRPGGEPDPSLGYLEARLGLIEARVRDAVARRRAVDPDPDDRFRGLYITDAQVDSLLAGPPDPLVSEETALASSALLAELDARAAATDGGHQNPLVAVATAFGLDALDIDLLLVALAPDLDPRFERLYGYLHDDVSRRRASVGLALELCDPRWRSGMSPLRARLGPLATLVARGLLIVEDADRPFLTRSLRVPDRVAAHLLGDDSVDPVLEALRADAVEVPCDEVDTLARALGVGVRLCYLRERTGSSGFSLARSALGRLGRRALVLDVGRLGPGDDIGAVAAAAAREAALSDAGLVIGPVDLLAGHGAAAVRAFAEGPVMAVLVGGRPWDPAWSRDAPLLLEAPVLPVAVRHELWLSALGDRAPVSFDPAMATLAFRLGPEQIVRAARAADHAARAAGRGMTSDDIVSGARAQNAAGLERLARRIDPRYGWDDLVLPRAIATQLREITARARHRDRVTGEWGIGHRAGRAMGITALFAGDSGTGKTMSAEVLAGDLGFDLYVIDLSTVVDKYIGETEKNLDRIFTEADRVNGVLLFDEADALFGKRSEVKDARDRYANVEVAYLLQRMESFDGIAILTTNLRANVDEAFTRRIDAIVDFPMPEEADRLALWRRNLPPSVPQAPDIDLPFLARRFKLAGGDIRNICVAAAYLAAADDRSVTMGDLIRATEREYRKLGRLTVEAEFGEYYGLVAGTSDGHA
jgi:hypothetical protein